MTKTIEIKSFFKNNKVSQTNEDSPDLNIEIKQRLTKILLHSSAHGIPNIVRSRNLFTTLMWSICLLLSIGFCSYYIITIIIDYFKYSTVTNIEVIRERQSQFPAISFCPSPRYNSSLSQIISALKFDQVNENNLSKYFEEFNDVIYGKCFRFNSGKNIYGETFDILNATKSGKPNNLRLAINLEMLRNYDFAEFLIHIHNHSSSPYDMDDGGYWIKPGSWNYYQVERVFNKILGQPYSECVEDINNFKLNKTIIQFIKDLNRSYSQKECFHVCSQLFALESNCNCISNLNRFDTDCIKQPKEEETSVKICIAEYLKNFRKNLQHENCTTYCPLECNSISYVITGYNEPVPVVSGNISTLTRNSYTSLNRFDTYDEVNKHFIVFYVYYKELQYTLISQVPKTETFSFVSNIGGILGLYLGISFLSLVEILEILFELFPVIVSSEKKFSENKIMAN